MTNPVDRQPKEPNQDFDSITARLRRFDLLLDALAEFEVARGNNLDAIADAVADYGTAGTTDRVVTVDLASEAQMYSTLVARMQDELPDDEKIRSAAAVFLDTSEERAALFGRLAPEYQTHPHGSRRLEDVEQGLKSCLRHPDGGEAIWNSIYNAYLSDLQSDCHRLNNLIKSNGGFDGIINNLEHFHGRGIVEFETLSSDQVCELQLCLREHISNYGDIDQDAGEAVREQQVRNLARLVDQDFNRLLVFDVDDELIVDRFGVVIIVDPESDEYQEEMLGRDVRRVHGKVVRVAILEVPTLEALVQQKAAHYQPHEADSDNEQTAVVLELDDVSLECEDGITSPADGSMVYLPLCYEQMRIKRHRPEIQ